MMFAAYARDKESRAGLLFGIEIVREAPLFFHRLAPRYGCRRKPLAGQLETWQCGSIPSCWSPSWSSPACSARAASSPASRSIATLRPTPFALPATRWLFRPMNSYFKHSAHRSNHEGVQASCGDCHIPRNNWFIEIYTHVTSGAKDVFAELTNNFSDIELREAHRDDLQREIRAEMHAQNSITCRSCHGVNAITPTNVLGRHAHDLLRQGLATCVDCHTNIVHPRRALDEAFAAHRRRTASRRFGRRRKERPPDNRNASGETHGRTYGGGDGPDHTEEPETFAPPSGFFYKGRRPDMTHTAA